MISRGVLLQKPEAFKVVDTVRCRATGLYNVDSIGGDGLVVAAWGD
jgi:hypothetical protein